MFVTIDVSPTDLMSSTFHSWVISRNIDISTPDKLRCAITVFSNFIQRSLSDMYDVEERGDEV